MNFELGTVLTLGDNKDYVVSQSAEVEGAKYLVLIEMPGYKTMHFAKLINEGRDLEIIDDDIEMIEKISAIVTEGNK